MDLTPIYRIEHFLDAIVNNSVNPYSPEFRVEYYLAKIAGENVTIPEPTYRIEFYLAYLCGEEVELPDPIYRIEYYLAFLCGLNVELPEPIYRVEFWLWDWCGGGGIEKTFTGTIARFLSPSSKPVKSIVCNIEPMQDLHGYDNPWPAGGGKNKFDIDQLAPFNANTTLTKNGGSWTIENNNSYSVDAFVKIGGGLLYYELADGQYTISISEATTRPIAIYYSDDGLNWSWFSNGISVGNTFCTFTVSGQKYIQFRCSVSENTTVTIKNFQLETGSTATAWTPYENECPISGFTGLNVYGTGVNVWDEEWEVGGINTTTGQNNSLTERIRSKNYISVKPGVSYYFGNRTAPSSNMVVLEYDKDHNFNGNVTYHNNVNQSTYSFGNGVFYIRFYMVAAYGTTYNNDISINYPSTDTDYHAYTGTTLPVSWQSEAGTVYAGYLSVDKAGNVTLTGTHVKDTFTKDSAWYSFATGTGNSSAVVQLSQYQNCYFKSGAASFNGAISSTGKESPNYWANSRQNEVPSEGDMCFAYSESGQLRFHRADVANITDIASFKANFPDTEVLYKLKNPVTYTLASVTVPSTVQGENNWWHDANGNITIEAIGTPISSDEPDALQSLNILLGGAYTPRANFSEPTDEQALNIILGR